MNGLGWHRQKAGTDVSMRAVEGVFFSASVAPSTANLVGFELFSSMSVLTVHQMQAPNRLIHWQLEPACLPAICGSHGSHPLIETRLVNSKVNGKNR
jgi:hypothetical protein